MMGGHKGCKGGRENDPLVFIHLTHQHPLAHLCTVAPIGGLLWQSPVHLKETKQVGWSVW